MADELTKEQIIWQQFLALEKKYRRRNENCRVLRSYYEGIDSYQPTASGLFLDSMQSVSANDAMSAEQISETGYYLVYNLLNSIVNKFIFQLAIMPEIQLAVIGAQSLEKKQLVDNLEKMMHGVLDINQMPVVLSNFAWYYSTLGLGSLQALPTKKDHFIDFSSLIPENVYPVMDDLDGRNCSAYYYRYIMSKSSAILQYPQHADLLKNAKNSNLGGMGEGVSMEAETTDDDSIAIIFYLDEKEMRIFNEGTQLFSHVHGWDFIPMEFAQAIPRPGRLRGQSPIEQSIAIASLYSDMMNYQAEVVAYGAAPAIDLFGTNKKIADIVVGPGAVNDWEADAKIQVRKIPDMPTDFGRFVESLREHIDDAAHISDIQHSRSDRRVDSGQVLSGLLGEFVQMIGYFQQIIGIKIGRLIGNSVQMIAKTRHGEIGLGGVLKGEAFIAIADTRTIPQRVFASAKWPPAQYDYATQVTIELQKLGAGVQGPYTTMQNLGIGSPVEEMQSILDWGVKMQQMRGGGQQMVDMGANKEDLGRRADLEAQEQNALERGDVTPGKGEMSPQTAPPEPIGGDEIRKLLSEVPIKGQAYLLGHASTRGKTNGNVELAVTNPVDKDTITNSPLFAKYKDRLRITRARKKK